MLFPFFLTFFPSILYNCCCFLSLFNIIWNRQKCFCIPILILILTNASSFFLGYFSACCFIYLLLTFLVGTHVLVRTRNGLKGVLVRTKTVLKDELPVITNSSNQNFFPTRCVNLNQDCSKRCVSSNQKC